MRESKRANRLNFDVLFEPAGPTQALQSSNLTQAITACLASAAALEPTHLLSGLIVPIPRAGTKLSHINTPS